MSKKIECKTKFFIEMFKTTCVVKKETLLTEIVELGKASSVKELQTVIEVKTFQDVDEVWRFINSHIPKVI